MVHFFFIEVEACFLISVFKFAEAEGGVSRSPAGSPRCLDPVAFFQSVGELDKRAVCAVFIRAACSAELNSRESTVQSTLHG